MSQDVKKDQELKDLSAAFEESATLSARILHSCIEENHGYFQSNSALFEKVSERLKRGKELAETGNHRAANIIQRHAIDLILQENHKVFKESEPLRKALLGYRDHDVNVLTPLRERHKEKA